MSLFVDVIFNLPLDKPFTYSVCDKLQKSVMYGKRVLVPFASRTLRSCIIKVHNNAPSFDCKEVIEVLDLVPVFSANTMYFASWLSSYYICSLGEALSLFLPRDTVKLTGSKQRKEDSLDKSDTKQAFLILNNEQKIAVGKIVESIENKSFCPYLIFGITGSGKTEVYKHLAQKAISKNKQALILVPEIALTTQTISSFKTSFSSHRIAVLHSRISSKDRYRDWKKIQEHKVDIILGARSAIFASVSNNLGIIIIDEEHELSYKSQDTPRYHARQFAYKLATKLNIPLVLGSATPSIESYFYALRNKLSLIKLINRHSAYTKQTTHIVDMKKESTKSFISKVLFEKISDRLIKKEKIIIFLNKRGHSPIMLCTECGHTLTCPNCDISLTYHKQKSMMLCHYCSYSIKDMSTCSSCNSTKISPVGYGTQKVTEELSNSFRQAVVKRMDFDSTRAKGAYESILGDFKDNKIDILVGTQMIAKGLHFPSVSLVGVLLADLSLNFPDFRATERTFSLLTQISGRAGRGSTKGEVVIQTYLPNNFVIKASQEQDYNAFYLREIEDRQKFFYPPFSRIVRFIIRGKEENKVIAHANKVYSLLREKASGEVKLLGPAMAPLGKINNNFRWQIILKSKKKALLNSLAKGVYKSCTKDSRVYVEIDIDPNSLM